MCRTKVFKKTIPTVLLALLCWSGIAQGITLTDEAGRDVQVPEHIKRIVSLAPSITEIVFALGSGDRLVGVTRFSNYPPQTAALPKVGSYVQPSIEKILTLCPDLVIGIRDGNPKIVVDRLGQLGVPTYVVNPKSLDGVIRTINNIGRVIHAEPAAIELTGQMSRRIRRVQRRVSDNPKRAVFFQIGVEPIVSGGRGTFIDVLIRTAGGINVAGEMTAYPHLSVEQVLAARPEVIFITSMARQQTFYQMKRFWQQWPGLPAVKNDRIHIIDSDLCDRPSPRIVEGLEMLARLIHPERFK
ncbi:MAG: ABC transporter substrate-binding protein [Syntrophobacteria bacterium]